jgi:hypothetical protein
LIDEFGTSLAGDPPKVDDLLRESVGDTNPDVPLLVGAAEVGVAAELARAYGSLIPAGRVSELATRLEDSRDMSPVDAKWAVQTWAWALSVEEQSPPPVAFGPGYAPPERPVRVHDRPFALAVVAFVVLVLGVTFVLMRGSSVPGGAVASVDSASPAPIGVQLLGPSVEVPDVVGETGADAGVLLEDADLAFTIVPKPTREAEPGIVLRQIPEPGTSVEQGTAITVVVAAELIKVGTPKGLSLSTGPTSVTLTWDEPTSGSEVHHYEIWRDGVKIGERFAGRRVFTDGGLIPGSSHLYGVIAVGDNGSRAKSRSKAVTLPVPEPSPTPTPPPFTGGGPPPPPPSPDPCTAPDPQFCE